MKYLGDSFSVTVGDNEAYRNNWEKIFGKKEPVVVPAQEDELTQLRENGEADAASDLFNEASDLFDKELNTTLKNAEKAVEISSKKKKKDKSNKTKKQTTKLKDKKKKKSKNKKK